MSDASHELKADHVFDGGAMDCGSGLVLLIRQNMLKVPEGGLLEIRSTEPTVETELPPWCRMVGHIHVHSIEFDEGKWKHWVRRGAGQKSEQADLDSDKQQARDYKWSLRVRRTEDRQSTVYSRNFSWQSGNSIDFDRTSRLPTSLEQFLGALLADVVACFADRCSRSEIVIDELEGTLKATLHDTLAAVGLESGDPSIKTVVLVVYVTTPAERAEVQGAWRSGLQVSPVYQTLQKSCQIETRIVVL